MDRWSDSFGKGMGAEESNEGIARGESGPCFHWHLTPGLSQAEASTQRSDQLPGPIGFTLGFFIRRKQSLFAPPVTPALAFHPCAAVPSVVKNSAANLLKQGPRCFRWVNKPSRF